MPTEGAKLSGAYKKQEPCTDTTLESPLNGRRRCKDVRIHILISGQWTEQNNNYSIAIRAAGQTGVLDNHTPAFFIYLGNFENERGNHHVGNIECN